MGDPVFGWSLAASKVDRYFRVFEVQPCNVAWAIVFINGKNSDSNIYVYIDLEVMI